MTRRPLPCGWLLLTLLTVSVGSFPLLAEETIYPEGKEGGQQLAAKLRANQPAENSIWDGTFKYKGADRKYIFIPVVCQTQITSSNWTVTYTTTETNGVGAEKLIVIHAGDASNQYFYARAAVSAKLGEPKPISPAEADVPLAGSDFWLNDLGLEFYHWPEQRVRKDLGSVHRSRGVHVLESVNPHPAPGGYGRVVTYIDKESEAPIEATAYAADGKTKLKEFSIGSVTRIKDHYELKDMEISNNKTHSTTTLLFDLKTK